MVKLPIDYAILNILQEPLTPNQVAEKLNIDKVIAKAYCNGLRVKGKVRIVSKIKSWETLDVYQSLVDIIYGICTKCEGVLDVNKLTNSICINCLDVDELDYGDFGTSVTQIQHMQNIISDQKRVINQLQQELYLLKKSHGNTI